MSPFDSVRRSLEATVESGWAPGLAAAIRYRGSTEFLCAGMLDTGSPTAITPSTPFRIASLSKPIGGALTALLIIDGTLGLEDPIERWLPEFADPRVLSSPDAELTDTVAATRPLTVSDLLTSTPGVGLSFDDTPLARELNRFAIGPIPPRMPLDDYLARLAALPLAYQPGQRWSYHTSADILSALLVRAAHAPLHDILAHHITGPLGMTSTGFSVDPVTLPAVYRMSERGLEVAGDYAASFSGAPPFESLAGGLLSTVEDYLAFLAALADDTLLPAEVRAQMTADQLSFTQREGMVEMGDTTTSWGWQVSVEIGPEPVGEPWMSPGRFGWTGGSGTSAYVDPSRDLIGVVMSQRMMGAPTDNFDYFWKPLYSAL